MGQLIPDKKSDKISDVYEIIEKPLGGGAFGTVILRIL
jgi:hypothetical protein